MLRRDDPKCVGAILIAHPTEEYQNNKIQNIAKNQSTRVGAAFDSPIYEEITIKNKKIINRANPTKNGCPKGALQNTGITLIALIITIILLLILTGVTIHFTLGKNGILRNAEIAGNRYKQASENETNMLDQIYAYMNGEKKLEPNTPTTKAGTPVEMPENWYKDTPAYYENGKEIEKSKKTASVYAVSDGLNNTIPIPVGFYYVGGNLESGVVISDNEKDANKYKDLSDVPSGLKLNSNGELESELKGNQFIWIPCNENEYKKETTYIYGSHTEWDIEIDMIGIEQTRKYGGFYVGRYEAGLASDIEEYTTQQDALSNIYNIQNKKPQSKAGIVPWNFINYQTARINSIEMYKEKNKSVTSGIITGTSWDVMIKKMWQSDNTKSLTASSSWGNYGYQIFNYLGRSAVWNDNSKTIGVYSSKTGISATSSKGENDLIILTTGASERNKLYNIYDVAGNLWEYTEETASFTSGKKQIIGRGGAVCTEARETDTIKYGAGYRYEANIDDIGGFFGFRVILYIK